MQKKGVVAFAIIFVSILAIVITGIAVRNTFHSEIKQVSFGQSNLDSQISAARGRKCTPKTCTSLGYECGSGYANGTCSGTLNCGTCSEGYTCNASGKCVSSSCVPQTCAYFGYECGSGYANGTCGGTLSCGSCSGEQTCNASGRCVTALCESNTYYVNFANGNDNNAGTCDVTAWKHVPGDNNATGIARSTNLTAGKTVKFKGGVVYNGMMRNSFWSGTSGNPIIFTSYGGSRAILDGTGCNNAIFDWSRGPGNKADWVYLMDLEIRNYWNYGVAINGSYNKVENCNIHTGLSGGGNEPLIIVQGDYNQIVNNEIHDSNWNCVNVQNANYTNISYNNIYDCPAHGGINLISNTGTYFGMMTGNDVHHNYIHDIGPNGAMYLRYQQNNKIYNNIIDLGPDSNASMNIYFSYGTTGGAPSSYTANTEVYNNLILQGRWSIFNDAANNLTIKNNIFKNPANNVFISMYPTTSGHVLDYNLYNGTGVWRINGNEYNTLASLPSPYEDNGLVGDPGFVNETGNDFRYLNTSDAIDIGTDLSSVGISDDYAGTSRPQGSAFDIGAYEYF